MSYERVLVNRWAGEMNTAAMHLAHAVGAGNRAAETAGQICPDMGAQSQRFFAEMGLMPKVGAIGNYIGKFMYDVYDWEVEQAIDYGYQDAAGALQRR